MRRHQGAKVKHFDVSNVIYHKFSHGTVSYTLKGEKVNVMLEFHLKTFCLKLLISQSKFSGARKFTLRYQQFETNFVFKILRVGSEKTAHRRSDYLRPKEQWGEWIMDTRPCFLTFLTKGNNC